MLVYKIDNIGLFQSIEHIELNDEELLDVDFDYVVERPPSGMCKPRWFEGEWIEGKTEEEFLEEDFLASLTPSIEELEQAEFELKTIELLIKLEVI